ncbi:YoaK family protein [Gordonia sp. NPDC003425]
MLSTTCRRVSDEFVRHPKHGALPILLLVLTVVTGLVDAASILALGRVFVANMTGNVVFSGFALAGTPGYSLLGSVLALAGFLVGAAGCGTVLTRVPRRGRALALGSATELTAVIATVVLLTIAHPTASAVKATAVTLLAIGLGVRNAVVRSLGVPDLTTTVLTMSLTGIGADVFHGKPMAALRRFASVATMLAGAAVGALTFLTFGVTPVLLVAAGLLAVVVAGALYLSDGPPTSAEV